VFRRSQAERELDEELRQHIDQQTEQNIRLGVSPEEARFDCRGSLISLIVFRFCHPYVQI
jgi:hypothetical protein